MLDVGLLSIEPTHPNTLKTVVQRRRPHQIVLVSEHGT
jgi:hypothetical protein